MSSREKGATRPGERPQPPPDHCERTSREGRPSSDGSRAVKEKEDGDETLETLAIWTEHSQGFAVWSYGVLGSSRGRTTIPLSVTKYRSLSFSMS